MIEVPGTDLIPGKQYWVVSYGPRSALPPHTRATLYKSHCTFTEGNGPLLHFNCDIRTFPIVNDANDGPNIIGGPPHHLITVSSIWNAHDNFIWKFYDVVDVPRMQAEKDARDREHAMKVNMENELESRGKSVLKTTPGVQPSNHPFDPGYFTRGGKGRRRIRRGKGTTRKRRASHRKRRTTRTSSRTKKTRKRGTRSRRHRL
jgi:hypothetical protein